MTKVLLASVIAALPFAAHAADLTNDYSFISESVLPAPPRVVGHLELGFGWLGVNVEEDDPNFDDGDLGVFEGWGRANIPFHSAFNLEIETGGVAYWDSGNSQSSIGGYGHLWYGPNGYRIGVFGGAASHDFVTGSVGVEGEVDLGNLTLGAQGSYNFTEDGLGAGGSSDYWGVRGWADLYVTPNTRIGGEIAWWQAEDFLSVSGRGGAIFKGPNIFAVSGRIEHRFAESPISVFARAEYFQPVDGDVFGEFDAVAVFAGLRVFIDGPDMTLQEHDHQVPFDVRNPMIMFPAAFEFIQAPSGTSGPPS